VYRAGQDVKAAAEQNSTDLNLHEWRKQVKYLWHQLRLLESAWKNAETDLGDQYHHLSQLLGDDHDLAVLRQTLAIDPLAYGGHALLKKLFVLIDRRRSELQVEAFALGRRLYKDSPKLFVSRLESYWKEWMAKSERNGKRASGQLEARGVS
jgi:hypothetical protein